MPMSFTPLNSQAVNTCHSVTNHLYLHDSHIILFDFMNYAAKLVVEYRLFNVLCWLWNINEGAELRVHIS